ncbi:MAG: protoporphyrinogen oxidase HemJ [Hyphomicrobium sp.]
MSDATHDIGASGASAGKRAGVALTTTVVVTALLIALLGDAAYPWIKAVHVIAIISWMAGLLYLPRLFIYHSEAAAGSVQSETFKVMERRLMTIIMTPAMVIAWALGLWLGYAGGHFGAGWFHAKLAAVLVLSGVHGYFAGAVRAFGEDRNDKPSRHWRLVNEIPTLLMIAIVILVVVKPF